MAYIAYEKMRNSCQTVVEGQWLVCSSSHLSQRLHSEHVSFPFSYLVQTQRQLQMSLEAHGRYIQTLMEQEGMPVDPGWGAGSPSSQRLQSNPSGGSIAARMSSIPLNDSKGGSGSLVGVGTPLDASSGAHSLLGDNIDRMLPSAGFDMPQALSLAGGNHHYHQQGGHHDNGKNGGLPSAEMHNNIGLMGGGLATTPELEMMMQEAGGVERGHVSKKVRLDM